MADLIASGRLGGTIAEHFMYDSSFAMDMLRWLNGRSPDLVAQINGTGKLGEELTTKLTDRINEYKAVYGETRKTVESR